MEISQRKSIHDDLRKYDHLAKDHSFIEITEWANGEGWDIAIDDRIIPPNQRSIRCNTVFNTCFTI